MRHQLQFFIALVISVSVTAQTKQADSIKQLMQKEKNDSARILRHLDLIALYVANRDYLDDALSEINKLEQSNAFKNRASFKPWISFYKGILNWQENKYLESAIEYNKAIKLSEQLKGTTEVLKLRAKIYTSLGGTYSDMNDWENAQSNYQKALHFAGMLNDSSLQSKIYLNTAFIFIDYQDWNNAAINLLKSLSFVTAKDAKSTQVTLFSSLANAYTVLKQPQKAWIYILKSDSVLKAEPSPRSYMFNCFCRAEYFYEAGKQSTAFQYSKIGLVHAREYGDSIYVAVSLEQNARICRAMKMYKDAEHYIKESVRISDMFNYLGVRNMVYYEYMFLLDAMGNHKEAFKVSSKLIMLTDSLNIVMNNNRRIIDDAAFEAQQKEQKINNLQTENTLQQLNLQQKTFINYLLVAGAIVLLLLLILSFYSYRQKQKLQQQRINELETQQQLAATEAVLKGEEQERTRLAKDLHDGLGGMLSGIKYSFSHVKGNLILTPENAQAFERSMDMLDTSIREMRRVAHNMMPEALVKFGLDAALKDFCNDISLSGAIQINYQSSGIGNVTIDQTISITVFRIVQELVNNIMKHAAAKNALVQLNKFEGRLSLTVEDDGKGFDAELLKTVKSIGWMNIYNRVEFLKGTVDIKTKPGLGTSVLIEVALL